VESKSLLQHIKGSNLKEQRWGIPEKSATVFKNILVGSLRHKHTHKQPSCSKCLRKAVIVKNKQYFCAECELERIGYAKK